MASFPHAGEEKHALLDSETLDSRSPLIDPELDAERQLNSASASPTHAAAQLKTPQTDAHVQLHPEHPPVMPPTYGLPAAQGVAGLIHIPELPSAHAEWDQQQGLMMLWLLTSIPSTILAIPFILLLFGLLGEVAGILGIVGACMYLQCRGFSIGDHVKAVHILATVCTVLDGIYAAMFVLLALGGGDAEVVGLVLVYTAWIVLHGVVSFYVAKRAYKMKQILHPVTAGMAVVV